jgi:rhomboid protease GluP
MDFADTVPSAGTRDEAFAREFQASWRSRAGSLAIFLWLIAVISGVMLVVARHDGFPLGWTLGTAALLLFGWLFARQVIGGRTALRVGPEGIRAMSFGKRCIPWADIAGIQGQTVQGQTHIIVSLAPHVQDKWWWGSRKKQQAIALVNVRSKEHPEALQAVLSAFAAYGGARFEQALAEQTAQQQAAADFEADLQVLTPVTWALYLMVGLNLAVWIANVVSGMGVMQPRPSELLAWGANSASSVVNDHQYWRLLSATFLHGGVIHLAFNMLGLWVAGQQLNRLHGNWNFLLIYLGSALTGSALSLHFSSQQSVSVGASGAVFGVLGALLVVMYQHRGQIPVLTGKNVLTSQGMFLAYALIQGFAQRGVDNAAHIGGLLAGAALAWILVEKIDREAASGKRIATAAAGVLLCVAAIAGLVATTRTPTVHHRQIFAFHAVLQRILPELQASEKAFQADALAFREKRLGEAQFIEAIAQTHLPAYQRIQVALAPLDIPASDTAGGGLRDLKQMNQLTVELFQLQLSVPAAIDADKVVLGMRMAALGREISETNARMNARLKAVKPAP